MSNSEPQEKRQHVRVPFQGNVTYRVLDEEEYLELCREKEIRCAAGFCGLVSENFDETRPGGESAVDPNLVRFLLHLEDKLDRVLNLLGDKPQKSMEVGSGVDISSSGLKFHCKRNLEPGSYLEMRFVVSRYPILCLDVLGAVIRVSPVYSRDAKLYEVATTLSEMDESAAEDIMAYAFRVQRESLRSMKSEQVSE